jgi:hypothetical protein
MESIEQTFNGSAGWGRRVTTQISRNGDLIHRVYLQVGLPAVDSGEYVDFVGLRLIKAVEIEIGGQRINFVGAQKHQDTPLLCKGVGNPFGGTQPLSFWPKKHTGMPQMLVGIG